jgi:hypothetical protein
MALIAYFLLAAILGVGLAYADVHILTIQWWVISLCAHSMWLVGTFCGAAK